jgi:hypothetical protein
MPAQQTGAKSTLPPALLGDFPISAAFPDSGHWAHHGSVEREPRHWVTLAW